MTDITAPTAADAHSRPHFDGCPECMIRFNRPVRTSRLTGGTVGGCLAHYVCRSCGHKWWTSWSCDGTGL